MNYATAPDERPQSEVDRISCRINSLLEKASLLSDQLGCVMDRLSGPTPMPDEKQSQARVVRSGILGHMSEQLEYLDGHVSRIAAHMDRLDKTI